MRRSHSRSRRPPPSAPSPRVSGCHFGCVSRRCFASISCHRSGCHSILTLAPVQPPSWLRFKHHGGCVSGAPLWLRFSTSATLHTPHPTPCRLSPLAVSAPQVAGLLPSSQISGRSRRRPFVWGGILPLFSHLACNLNTQNIPCLTNRP